MQNKVEFTLPPQDLFLNPGQDPGLTSLGPPAFLWRARPPARILGINAVENDQIAPRVEGMMTKVLRHKRFAQAVEFATVPVQVAPAVFKKSYITAAGRGLLSGASGVRLLNRYVWDNDNRGEPGEDRLTEWFARCQAENRQLFAREGRADPDLPFAVECRNTFNYFHFLTESLCQLCLLDDIGGDRPVYLHFPNEADKTRPFAQSFVQALFPEHARRVRLERSPKRYDRALVPFNLMNLYYQTSDALMPRLDALAPRTGLWQGRHASRASHGILQANAVDANLYRLRARALAAIEGMDFSHLPRRFYAGRLPGQARNRAVRGEGELLDMLALFDIQPVAFETLSPLEQIGLMAHAELMVAPHGAGFTNMLFANPAATVVELGTLQTGMYRWGDFWQLAHVSGARYVTVFADFANSDPGVEPKFSAEGIVPVHLTRAGLAVLMSFLATLLGRIARYNRPADVLRLARLMNAAGLPDRTMALLAAHPGVDAGHPDLLRARAAAHRALGDAPAELSALEQARDADPDNAFAAQQVVWCAGKLADPAALARALATLQHRFPAKWDEMMQSQPWLRRRA